MTGIDVLACSIFVAQLSVSAVVLKTLQAGEDSEARWHAEALPPSYVSRYLRGRVVASRCAIGSGFTSAETLQHKDHRTALRAILQSAASAKFAWRKPNVKTAKPPQRAKKLLARTVEASATITNNSGERYE